MQLINMLLLKPFILKHKGKQISIGNFEDRPVVNITCEVIPITSKLSWFRISDNKNKVFY